MNTAQPYERPGIVRHQIGALNKFGQRLGPRVQTHIDGVAIADLIAKYGSPLFVFSERTLVERYRDLEQAFSRRYPSVRLAWSYKTNYLQAICRVFHREGAFAEVVSPFEWDKAVTLGVPPERIHFNGPYKPNDALARAIAGGSILHVDNLDEIARIERIAQAGGRRARVAIRVNMSIDGVQSWSRFGLNLESGQAHEAITRVLGGQAMDLIGLHTHIGTFVQDPQAYGTAASKMARLANELRARHGTRVSFIDLGGGFASPNTLKSQYLDGQQASPPFSRYAEAICAGLAELDCPAPQMPTLVLETGRALVDEAGSLISTVQATKRLPDGRRALVIDAGVNLLFTAFWYRHEVEPGAGGARPRRTQRPLRPAVHEHRRDARRRVAAAAGDRRPDRVRERRRLQRHAVDAVHHDAAGGGDDRRERFGRGDPPGGDRRRPEPAGSRARLAALGHSVAGVSAGPSRWLRDARRIADTLLRSYAQILIARSRVSGFLLLAATALDFRTCLGGLTALVGAAVVARAMTLAEGALAEGPYGYNALFAGLAIGHLFGAGPGALALAAAWGGLSVLFTSAFVATAGKVLGLPALTVPFLVATYLLLFVAAPLGLAPRAEAIPAAVGAARTPALEGLAWVGALVFVPRVEAGALVLAALLIHSRIAFLLGAVGAMALVPFLRQAGVPAAVAAPLLFNGVLAAISLGGTWFVPSLASFGLAAAGAALCALATVALQRVLAFWGLPLLVLPFNVVVLVVLCAMRQRARDRLPKAVDFAPGSPERNLRFFQTRIARAVAGTGVGVAFGLPFRGSWICTQGIDGAHTHQGLWRHAFDFEVIGQDGRLFLFGEGSRETIPPATTATGCPCSPPPTARSSWWRTTYRTTRSEEWTWTGTGATS